LNHCLSIFVWFHKVQIVGSIFKKRGAAAGLSGQVRGQKRGSAGPAVAPKVALRVAACQPLLALRACLVNPCRGGLNRLGFSESKPMHSLVFS